MLGFGLAGIRHQVTVVTKIGNWGKREGDAVPKTSTDLIRLCAHACLFRLRTDWIDVLLCHEGNIEDPSMYVETFRLLKQQGLIQAFGISTDDINVLKRFNQDGDCDVVQLRYSLLDRSAEEELLPYCQEHNIGVMLRGPVGMGLLSGQYSAESRFAQDDMVRNKWNPGGPGHANYLETLAKVDQLKQHFSTDPDNNELITAALRFGISHPAVHCAIPGARSPKQAHHNAAAGARTLTPKEQQVIEGIS